MSRNTTAKSFSNTAATGTATKPRCDSDSGILKIKMVTVQVNGNEMAWVCENFFDTPTKCPNMLGRATIHTPTHLKTAKTPEGACPPADADPQWKFRCQPGSCANRGEAVVPPSDSQHS